jgi:hypothetical protein
MKIDQEEFNRRAQHILDTVVKPQVEKYEQAKAEGTLLPKPRQVGASGFAIEQAAANLADPNACKTDNWIAGALWMREQKRITLSRFRRIYQDFMDEKITMSRMVELLNEQEEQDDRIL